MTPNGVPVLRSVDFFMGNLPQQLSSLVGRENMVAEVAGEFSDGVWMIELASVGDPASVPAAIAAALGITPQGDAALIDTVAEALGGRRLLLVVDNCEHV